MDPVSSDRWQLLGQVGCVVIGSLVLAVSSGQMGLTFPDACTWFLLAMAISAISFLMGYTLVFPNRFHPPVMTLASCLLVLALCLYVIGVIVAALQDRKHVEPSFWGAAVIAGIGFVACVLMALFRVVHYFRHADLV